jgi:hypothetical protein
MKELMLFTIAALTLLNVVNAQNSGSLNLSAGKKYAVENKVTTLSTSEMMGQSMETNATVTSVFSISLGKLKDNNYEMTNTISAVRMSMSTVGQNVNFDSDKKEDMDGPIGSAIKGYVNHPQPVVMDQSGTIIIAREDDSTQATDSSKQAEIILKQLGDPLEQGFGAKMAFLPVPKNIAKGNLWQDSTSGNGVTRLTKYEVKSINGKIAAISISGTEKRDTKMEMNNLDISTKTTGTFTGEVTVDITTGVIQHTNITEDASGNISVLGQDIPTTIKVTSETTVKSI